jgi:drug/metabolite transporter (DMT)-like permease
MVAQAPLGALLKALFAVVVWGASFVATKVALAEVPPMTIVWLRFAMGVAVLGVVVLARREFAWVSRRDLGYFALLGLIGITIHQWLQANGLVTSQAGTTAWIVASGPIFIALLGRLVLGERLGAGRIAGIALAAAGVVLVAVRGDLSLITAGKFGSPGDILILLSAPNWAVFSVLSRRGLREHASGRMMFYVMTIGWLLVSLMLLAGTGGSEIDQLTLRGWLSIGFLGVFCSGIAYVFWFDALQAMPASQVGALLYIEPLVTVAVAAAVLGEPIVLATIVGGVMILFGVWLVNRPATNRRTSDRQTADRSTADPPTADRSTARRRRRA